MQLSTQQGSGIDHLSQSRGTIDYSAERIEAAKRLLPEDPRPYADIYFLRTLDILKAKKLNPWVVGQVMVRKGPGQVGGIDEALAIIDKYSDLKRHGGRVYALQDGDFYQPGDTVLRLEGPIQDIVALETMYLGVISGETTRLSEGLSEIDLRSVQDNAKKIVEAAGGRLVVYFGARHWRWDQDAAISQATFNAGVATSSTAAGASLVSRRPVGTIPHVLENVLAWRYGKERAVVESTKAFDREIDPEIKRIALIDYNNREIDDSLAVAEELGERLYGVRVDTCGENMAQGALTSPEDPKAAEWRAQGLFLPEASHRHAKYWYGSGVTITGVFALRRALDSAGFKNVQIILTSGFGDQQKVLAFREAERLLGIKLFESLGVGGFYESRAAKMDIVMVGEDRNSLTPISKAGRGLKPNPAMKLRLGEEPDKLC